MAYQDDQPKGSKAACRRKRPVTLARRSRVAATLAAGLVGGTLLSTCQTRVRDAFVSSSKDLFLSLFSPEVFLAALDPSADETTDGE